MKRNNLKKISIGLFSAILFAVFTLNVNAESACANYKQLFSAPNTGEKTSDSTLIKGGSAYKYWSYKATYSSNSASGLAFCIDPAKPGWGSSQGYCGREVNPNASGDNNVVKFDRALTALYQDNDLNSNYEASDLAVKMISYYYGMGSSDGSLSGEYTARHNAFKGFAEQLKSGKYTADCGKDYYFCDKSGSASSSLNKAIAMANGAIKAADDNARWNGGVEVTLFSDKDATIATTSDENMNWQFYENNSGKLGNAIEAKRLNGVEWKFVNGYTGSYIAQATIQVKVSGEISKDEFFTKYKFGCVNSVCNMDASSFVYDSSSKTVKVKINAIRNTNDSDETGVFGLTGSQASGKNVDIVILNRSGVNTGATASNTQRYVAFLDNQNAINGGGNNGFNIRLPKINNDCANGTCKCKIVNGVYYDNDGKVTTKEKYEKECPSDYTCKYVGGKYYGKNGTVVDKETFDRECPADTSTKCDTTIKTASECNDLGRNADETYDGKITGPRDITGCFFDGTNGQDVYDEGGSTYKLSNNDEANGVIDNRYCSVYCKEDYVMRYPTTKYANSGSYFSLKLKIHGEKTCYEKIDTDLFDSDIKEQQQKVADLYNKYVAYKAMKDYNGSKNACGGYTMNLYVTTVDNEANEGSMSFTGKVGDQGNSELFCSRATDDYNNYQFASVSNLNSEINRLKSELDDEMKTLTEMVEDMKNCGITDNNKGWISGADDDDLSEKDIEKWYNPDITYDYESKYDNKITDQNFETTKLRGSVDAWSCDGDVNNHFDKCTNGSVGEEVKTSSRKVLSCDKSDYKCKSVSVDIPTTKYFKVTSSVDATYTSKTLYSTKYPSGNVYQKDGRLSGKDNYSDIKYGVPIRLDETDGAHAYSITINNLGKYYDDGDGKLGRLISLSSEKQSNSSRKYKNSSKKSVFKELNETATYMCWYIVNECEGGYITDDNGNDCCVDDGYINGKKVNMDEYRAGNINKKDVSCTKCKHYYTDENGEQCCDDPDFDETVEVDGKKYCQCIMVTDEVGEECCDFQLEIREGRDIETCKECTEYTDEENRTCCKEDTIIKDGKRVCCDDCDVFCVCDKKQQEEGKCVQVDQYTCVYKNSGDCNGEDCPVECVGSNCIVVGGGKKATFNMRTISESNVNANETSSGSNWSSSNEKAATAIKEIQGSATSEKTPEYSFTLTPAAINALRNVNWDEFDGEDKGLVCETVDEYENIKCTSKFLDEVNNGEHNVKTNTFRKGETVIWSSKCKIIYEGDQEKINECVKEFGPAYK